MVNKYTSETSPESSGGQPPVEGGTSAGPRTDLVLLALAAGLEPSGGWQSAGIYLKQLARLKKEQTARLAELRTLTALGGSLQAVLLTDLLKARVYERLLASDSAAELERLAKIIERLPEDPVGRASVPAKPINDKAALAGTKARPTADQNPDSDIDAMELEEALAEAKRLIAQLDDGKGQSLAPACIPPLVSGSPASWPGAEDSGPEVPAAEQRNTDTDLHPALEAAHG